MENSKVRSKRKKDSLTTAAFFGEGISFLWGIAFTLYNVLGGYKCILAPPL